jgi:hypothetical protein
MATEFQTLDQGDENSSADEKDAHGRIQSPTPRLTASCPSIVPERGLDSAVAAGASWVRSHSTMPWPDVEPIE